MAHEAGTVSSIDDLMTKLDTFATSAGWTRHNTDLSLDYFTLSQDDCYVTFRWSGLTDTNLAIYQSLGFIADGTLPHLQTDDSGNGSTTSPATTERRVNFTDGTVGGAFSGPFVGYEFFASEGATPTIYVVVEVVAGVFRHFCFGNAIKTNDWTGGGFVGGHYWANAITPIDNPINTQHTFLTDGLNSSSSAAATLHVEGMPGQLAAEKWGVFMSFSSTGTDTGGNNRLELFGTPRAGLYTRSMAWLHASQLNAYKPLTPINIIHRDTGVSPNAWYWLGELPDIAIVNMAFYSAGDEITVGSDTWVVFPWVRNIYNSPGSNTEESWNGGVAYKKVI